MGRILLVDDQPRNLLALEALLVRPGRELVSVESGVEAIAALRQRNFALAVLDVMMPGMDGAETALALRSLAPDLPIVFVTALDADAALMRDIQRMADAACLRKPIDGDALRRKVDEVEQRRAS